MRRLIILAVGLMVLPSMVGCNAGPTPEEVAKQRAEEEARQRRLEIVRKRMEERKKQVLAGFIESRKAAATALERDREFLRKYAKERGWNVDAMSAETVRRIAKSLRQELRGLAAAKKHCSTIPRRAWKTDSICLSLLCPGFTKEHYDAAVARKVRIGMDACLIRAAWGEPEDINKTITSGLVEEQWVYGSRYLYLENGRLRTIQDF